MLENIIYSERAPGITIDRIRREAGFTMAVKHLHSEYEIYYLAEGERYYFIDSRTYHVRKGGLVLIDKNQIHKTSQAGSAAHDRILIGLTEEALNSFLAFTGELSLEDFFKEHRGVVQLDEEGQDLIEGLLRELAGELSGKKTGYFHMALCLLSQLFIYLERSLSSQGSPSVHAPLSSSPKHRKVDEVASYITSHYSEDISLAALADRFFVNKSYLSRIFKEATGFTVVEYMNLCRIREARRLLLSDGKSITEISGLVGYDTITYFERVFRSYTQTSPLQFRKQYSHRLEPVSVLPSDNVPESGYCRPGLPAIKAPRKRHSFALSGRSLTSPMEPDI
ncbi:AraC family transcriptional regulator [Lacrimispora sp. 210928-DFI.3.58]|uniref:AraC family transcriptional regulator n=1 Tax=Lacrimispora sp. 210928-DFI.3.58 TaxID=2883214 RepID=UPI0015B3E4F4|nr:helix-turn-helix domain-containing protein [Lacrimispora sp. 210928-DFI.3.58]MCB7319264.1 helix-turn-helix domain-containing protein [Lacrimispora sp. 210928-DFI.3.58]